LLLLAAARSRPKKLPPRPKLPLSKLLRLTPLPSTPPPLRLLTLLPLRLLTLLLPPPTPLPPPPMLLLPRRTLLPLLLRRKPRPSKLADQLALGASWNWKGRPEKAAFLVIGRKQV
jgi:hypothetical protein